MVFWHPSATHAKSRNYAEVLTPIRAATHAAAGRRNLPRSPTGDTPSLPVAAFSSRLVFLLPLLALEINHDVASRCLRAHRGRCAVTKTVLLIALAFVVIDSAPAVEFSVGQKEVIYTNKQRTSKKLGTWPDGNLGVVRNAQGGYEFYGANGGSPAKTTGTLATPGNSKQSVSITNLPNKAFDYVSGGPIYQDPTSGARLMIYHAETHGKSAKDFYSMLGMAVSTDSSGLQFRDLGIIVQPNLSSGQAEIGGGSFAIMGDYMQRVLQGYGSVRRHQRTGRRAGSHLRSRQQRARRPRHFVHQILQRRLVATRSRRHSRRRWKSGIRRICGRPSRTTTISTSW